MSSLPPPPTPAHLGAAIRALREERELTIEALAGDSGVNWTYLSGIERGKRNPSWEIVGKISRGLKLEMSELARAAGEQGHRG